ncbi:glycosyltransferase [Zunongwangia sp. SCSIO 43204]|nr:glycosyltransferase [Zunongwangia sp. SCSIO 43204]
MISMSSIHFFRWVQQLENSGHEVYWIDVFDSNTYISKIDFVHQIIGWRYRWDYPGRQMLKKSFPILYNFIGKFNERKLEEIVRKKLDEIEPDLVHSFILQSAVLPILKIMQRDNRMKWAYSAWGNDLYYRKQNKSDLMDIKRSLSKIDYMFADCTRDHYIALKNNFYGEYLGTFPTGGGYDFNIYKQFIKSQKDRNTLLIKGYQGKFGRCNIILEAILGLEDMLKDYNIVVFGANQIVEDFCNHNGMLHWDNFEIKMHIGHNDVIKLMGQSKIYIGNSISDGMPNTLLEAIIMDAFPIQSNPGGASAEIINNGINGLLIHNPEDVREIRNLIEEVLENPYLQESSLDYNKINIKPKLERELVKLQVLEKYSNIENEL